MPEFAQSNPNRKSVGNAGSKPKLGEIEDQLHNWILKQRADNLIVARGEIQLEALRLVDGSALPETFKAGTFRAVFRSEFSVVALRSVRGFRQLVVPLHEAQEALAARTYWQGERPGPSRAEPASQFLSQTSHWNEKGTTIQALARCQHGMLSHPCTVVSGGCDCLVPFVPSQRWCLSQDELGVWFDMPDKRTVAPTGSKEVIAKHTTKADEG